MQNGNPHGLHAARRSSATSCSTENTKTGPQNYAVTGGHTIQVHGKSQRTSLINKNIVTIQNLIRKIASSMLSFCSCGYFAK